MYSRVFASGRPIRIGASGAVTTAYAVEKTVVSVGP